jgi:peptide/nickel transport system substrate-binding protein
MRQSTHRRTTLIAAAALIAVAIAGCGGSGANKSTGLSGGDLRIGSLGAVDSMNPFVGVNGLDSMSYRVEYPFLLQYTNAGHLVPNWATHDSLSNSGKTWTFTTRAGAKWSDGHPLTAADAAWTINTMVKFEKGPTALYASFLTNVTGAQAPSPTTLVVDFTAPTGTAGDGFANIPILPEHVWERYARGSGAGLKQFANTSPVGAGPFLLSHFAANQSALFKRNPDYYGVAPKLAGFGTVTYGSPDALVEALQTNAVDVITPVPQTAIKTLKANPQLKVIGEPGYDTSLLGINSSPNAPHPVLNNPTVRQAILLALNRTQINDTVNLGYGGVGSSILAPNQPFSDPSLPPPAYDPAKANQLLDSLGFKMGPNGIRIADGHPMQYVLRFPNVTANSPLVENLVIQDLKKIGIALQPQTSDFKSYEAAIFKNKYSQFDFTIDDYNPLFDVNVYLVILTCGQLNSENESGYCNATYDKLFAKQASQFGAARQATLDQMQQMIYQQKPLIPITYNSELFAMQKKVQNFPPTPIPLINYESTLWLAQITLS